MIDDLKNLEQPSSNSFVVRLLAVTGLFTLVLGPILGRYFSEHEAPRWQLAYASNEFDRGAIDSAKEALDRAYARDPSIIEDLDFVQVRFNTILYATENRTEEIDKFTDELINAYKNGLLRKNSDDSPEEGKSQLATAPRVALLADSIAEELLERDYAKQAVKLMDELYPPMAKRGLIRNNFLAYCRAIAGVQLDLALQEINLALDGPQTLDKFVFLDTKAWVLHQRNENFSALEYSDRAIDQYYESLPSKLTVNLDEISAHDSNQESNQGDKSVAHGLLLNDSELGKLPLKDFVDEQSEASIKLKFEITKLLERQEWLPNSVLREVLHKIAVLRFHRLRILESLRRSDASLPDRIWLRSYGFDHWDDLR